MQFLRKLARLIRENLLCRVRLVTWASLRQVVHAPGGDRAIRRGYDIVRSLLSGRRPANSSDRFRSAAVRWLLRNNLGSENVTSRTAENLH